MKKKKKSTATLVSSQADGVGLETRRARRYVNGLKFYKVISNMYNMLGTTWLMRKFLNGSCRYLDFFLGPLIEVLNYGEVIKV